MSTPYALDRKTPWHLWVVAILTLLWNGSGAITILLAQLGRLPDISADEAAYYAAQPSWFAISSIATFAPFAAGIALLVRSRLVVLLFALSLALILANSIYELAAGVSRALANPGAMVVTIIIVAIAILQLVYANAMNKRGVLR